jgi:hypothetical protein
VRKAAKNPDFIEKNPRLSPRVPTPRTRFFKANSDHWNILP